MSLSPTKCVILSRKVRHFLAITDKPIMMTIKCYPKSEFALLYFPDSDAHVALNRLNSWIRRCPELQKALIACNQTRFAKFFSAQAVRLIIEYLGEP